MPETELALGLILQALSPANHFHHTTNFLRSDNGIIVISRAPPGRCDLWDRYRRCYPRLISGIPPGCSHGHVFGELIPPKTAKNPNFGPLSLGPGKFRLFLPAALHALG